MKYLIDNWNEVRSAGQLNLHLEKLYAGKIPHTKPIFAELFEKLEPAKAGSPM